MLTLGCAICHTEVLKLKITLNIVWFRLEVGIESRRVHIHTIFYFILYNLILNTAATAIQHKNRLQLYYLNVCIFYLIYLNWCFNLKLNLWKYSHQISAKPPKSLYSEARVDRTNGNLISTGRLSIPHHQTSIYIYINILTLHRGGRRRNYYCLLPFRQ